jgi:ribonuclease P/MRP protein subunit POP3
MAIDIDAPVLSMFGPFLDKVPTLSAPWLRPQEQALVPTHIKQVRTSAPQDMRAAKEQRARGKMAAKERKKMMEREK